MEFLLFAAFAALLLGPLFVWQVLPRVTAKTESVHDDGFKGGDKGQNRWPGSRQANNEVREILSGKGIDLSTPQTIVHSAERAAGSSSSCAEALQNALALHHYEDFEVFLAGELVSFSETVQPASQAFDKRTMELNDFLHEHGWIYTGWSHAGDKAEA